MKMHEAMLYLPIKGINPLAMAECCAPNCTNKYVVAKGFAFPGTAGGEQVSMFFFCSTSCYLDAVPIHALPSA